MSRYEFRVVEQKDGKPEVVSVTIEAETEKSAVYQLVMKLSKQNYSWELIRVTKDESR